MSRTYRVVIWCAVGAFLIFGLAVPLSGTICSAFSDGGSFSLTHVKQVFSDPAERSRLLTSLSLAAVSTLATVALGLPLAWLSARTDWPGKRWLSPLLLLPMIAPPFVGAIGMKRLLTHFGLINRVLLASGLVSAPVDFLGSAKFWGVVVMEVLHLYPIMYLNLAAALANIDPSMEEASYSLGAGRLRTFRKVTLPLAFPGLFAGASIVFIWAFTDLGTPLIFDYGEVVSKKIYDMVADERVNPAGHALTVVVLAVSALIFWMGRRALRSRAMLSKVAARAEPRRLGRAGAIGASCLFLGVAGLALLPHAAVILTSLADRWFLTALPESYGFQHLATACAHDLVSSGVRNSLFYSLGSTLITLVLGLAAALLVVRGGGRGGSFLDALMMVPLAVPGLVLAFGFLGTYSGIGAEGDAPGWLKWLGAAIDPRTNPTILLILAYAVRRIPLVFRSATAGLEQCPHVLEEASYSLGAGPLRTVRKVTLPLIGANLAAGAILAFSYAMLEVSQGDLHALRAHRRRRGSGQRHGPAGHGPAGRLADLRGGIPRPAHGRDVQGLALQALSNHQDTKHTKDGSSPHHEAHEDVSRCVRDRRLPRNATLSPRSAQEGPLRFMIFMFFMVQWPGILGVLGVLVVR
ncbi:MAG: ABC transporter permease [Planctomycetota bacterium]|jgi:iron(III) transport system permease protein